MVNGHDFTGCQIYVSPAPKIRLGGPLPSAGRVVIDLSGEYDTIFSCGGLPDTSFESALLNHTGVQKATVFDFRTKEINPPDERLKLVPVSSSSETIKLIQTAVSLSRNSFIKLDIQGLEAIILPALIQAGCIKNIKQLVVQMFTPQAISTKPEMCPGMEKYTWAQMLGIMKTLSETHVLVHCAPNNEWAIHLVDDMPMPYVFTATWIRKDCFNGSTPKKSLAALPAVGLDVTINPERPTFVFSGAPWTA